MVDEQTPVDLVTGGAQIASQVSRNDVGTGILPLAGSIELLVDPTIEAEGGGAHSSTKGEVSETIFKRFTSPEFTVCPNH